ncbi:MAG: hypothetical protein K1X74_06175 [Pirellulales bacterium]|nr:hypothetical protein [Pirellulales bacterium]
MNDPQHKPKSQFVSVPDWEDYPPALRPLAQGIFFLTFPLLACLRIGATLWAGALFLVIGLSFLFSVISAGPIAIVLVAVATMLAARWTFGSQATPSSDHLRGRPVERRDTTPKAASPVRGRSLVRRSVETRGGNSSRR